MIGIMYTIQFMIGDILFLKIFPLTRPSLHCSQDLFQPMHLLWLPYFLSVPLALSLFHPLISMMKARFLTTTCLKFYAFLITDIISFRRDYFDKGVSFRLSFRAAHLQALHLDPQELGELHHLLLHLLP